MSTETANDAEELMQYLGDHIEEIERILYDDEDFCNKDIDATYQTAVKYVKSMEEKFHEKLNELKQKLDRIREENLKTSKQNKKQFDDETEIINQLFSSGKHEEAKQKFQEYERCFQQRVTINQTIPKLYMNDIDINRYLSFEKPLDVPVSTPVQETKQGNENLNQQECSKSSLSSDIRYNRFDSQQVPTNTNSISKHVKSPATTVPTRSFCFSTRLTPSPVTKNISMNDSEKITPPSVQHNHTNSRENITSFTSNSTPAFNPQFKYPTRPTRTETLTPILVAAYQHERNLSLIMACNKDYIILFKSQSDRLFRWDLHVIVRYNKIAQDLDWDVPSITSVGSIDRKHLYIFTENEFIIYSLDSFSKTYSFTLFDANDHHVQNNDTKRGTGTVFHDCVYHISYNNKCRWILSIFDLKTMNYLFDYDLTDAFPDVERFIHICVNDTTVGFLVQLDSSQYAVIFCSDYNQLTMQSRRIIPLSYAENPLTICSVYVHCLQKCVFFINDPSAKIIHLITTDKYIQSYPIVVHSLCYLEENNEILLTSNDGIYSIQLKEHESFFLKLH